LEKRTTCLRAVIDGIREVVSFEAVDRQTQERPKKKEAARCRGRDEEGSWQRGVQTPIKQEQQRLRRRGR
jgi:hypothetical protein